MPLTSDNRLAYRLNRFPKCPHCDHEIDPSDHEMWHLYYGTDYEKIDCPSCRKEVLVVTEVTHTFSTDQQDEDLL